MDTVICGVSHVHGWVVAQATPTGRFPQHMLSNHTRKAHGAFCISVFYPYCIFFVIFMLIALLFLKEILLDDELLMINNEIVFEIALREPLASATKED